ncbi:hypothetical protein [Marimonas arenosa]|nr:hypothetical protein [Marimonas arenosa]
MKNSIATLAAVAAITFSAAGGALAADKSKMSEGQIISTMDEAASSSSPGILLPLLVLVIVAAAVSSSSSH